MAKQGPATNGHGTPEDRVHAVHLRFGMSGIHIHICSTSACPIAPSILLSWLTIAYLVAPCTPLGQSRELSLDFKTRPVGSSQNYENA